MAPSLGGQAGRDLPESDAEALRDSWEQLCQMSHVGELESRPSGWDPVNCALPCLFGALSRCPLGKPAPNASDKPEGLLTYCQVYASSKPGRQNVQRAQLKENHWYGAFIYALAFPNKVFGKSEVPPA